MDKIIGLHVSLKKKLKWRYNGVYRWNFKESKGIKDFNFFPLSQVCFFTMGIRSG